MKGGGAGWLALVLGAAACHPPPTPPSPTPRALPLCRDAWAGLPADYDLVRDGQPTPEGNKGYAAYAARVERRACRKPWSVLVYMAADNDLAPYAYLNLYEMEAAPAPGEASAASSVDTDVLVRLDTPGRRGLRRLHLFPVGERYDPAVPLRRFFRSDEGALRSPLAALDDEPAAVDVEADLRGFLRWGIENYPADHHMVVVWGHGHGYGQGDPPPASTPAPTVAATTPAPAPSAAPTDDDACAIPAQVPQPAPDPFSAGTGGVAFSFRSATHLGVAALRQVLTDTVAGPLGGRPIDVYLADACLMHGLEVLSELADSARFLVGSVQVQDYLGMAYRGLLQRLNAPGVTPAALARAMPETYAAALGPGGGPRRCFPAAARTFTLAALDAAALHKGLLPAFYDLARALRAYALEARLQRSGIIDVFSDARSHSFRGNTRDLGGLLDRLQRHLDQRERALRTRGGLLPAGRALRSALTTAQAALATAQPAPRFGGDYADEAGFAALSLWLPTAADYARVAPAYAGSALWRGGAATNPTADSAPWPALLATLYGAAP